MFSLYRFRFLDDRIHQWFARRKSERKSAAALLPDKNLITDIERVGDLTEDLAEAAQKRIEHQVIFSPTAIEDIDRLCKHAHHTYMCALNALRDRNRDMAQHVCELEDTFDEMYLNVRQGTFNAWKQVSASRRLVSSSSSGYATWSG